MIKPRFLNLFLATFACSAALAQSPADKPLTEGELLKQIESLNPNKGAKATTSPASADPLFNNSPQGSTASPATASVGTPVAGGAPAVTEPGKPGEKKAKGPTEITAMEATFDQHANLAVFVGSVVVKDPEFNVKCDKLTAHLKHEEKEPAPAAGKTTPKTATPAAGEGGASKKKGGGLESALAESTSERRVVITQDKVEADGSITHGIGIADKANYNAITGDIILTGNPDVTQGINRCIATDPITVMTLNRDGHMTARGPHKTIITDTSESTRDSK